MPLLGRKILTKMNMELWINTRLLEDGFFTNVDVGETNFYGTDISQLSMASDDPTFQLDGMVWQSAFKEWVHESGIIPNQSTLIPPVVASGITVDGTFYSKDPLHPDFVPAFAHSIDYRNGRIIFDSPISTSSIVQGEFGYKHVTVDFADEFEGENRELLIETSLKDNPAATGAEVYPGLTTRTLPLILIDFQQRTSDGYELGSKSLVADFRGDLHVWTRDNYTRDLLEDFFAEKQRDVLFGINFNSAPFPLNYIGDKNSSFTSYNSLANLASPHFWRRIYLDSIEHRLEAPLYNIERSRISFLARVFPNF